MLDVKWVRSNLQKFDEMLTSRGVAPLSSEIIKLDEEKRELITLLQELQQVRNEKAKLIGYLKDKNPREFEDAKRDANHINNKIEEINTKLSTSSTLDNILDMIPNILSEDVPNGTDESMNVEVKSWGNIRISKGKDHTEIGEFLGMMDFTQTSKISGSRFVTLKSTLALLERALVNFMLDIHTQNGFVEVSPPFMVRNKAMYNAGQLPKFSDESFITRDEYRLIPTAEVSLVNLFADKIVNMEDLPIRMCAHTPCFRAEAGSAGRDTKGMIRLHQFSKVELVSFCSKEDASKEHDFILRSAENILQKLDLPYKIMLLCSGDTGFHSKKTFDINVWMPGQGAYREISSCSDCGDFQSRRMKARYKFMGENIYMHTLNGSGLPIGRTIVAILENYQNEDGSVTIPEVLRNYMNGLTKITPIK